MRKTQHQVTREFLASGRSIAEWARLNGFNVNIVYQVLRGERKAIRGQSHDIAVRLGIKNGEERSTMRLAA
jgi:gp16 family phage-associated protein